MEKRRQFKITPLHTHAIPYDPLVDQHLQYYFSSKNNRHVLLKTKVVNRKNEILDRNLTKMIEHGQLNIHNRFRLKKSRPKRYDSKNERSLENKANQLSSTVGKKQFQEFLQSRRNELKSKTMQMRMSLETGKSKELKEYGDKKEH